MMLSTNHSLKSVIVVDAYSTGKYLPAEIQKRGYACIHVISRENLPTFITSNIKHDALQAEILFNNDLPSLLNQISAYQVVAVITGAETGVEVAEQIADRLKLPGNHPSTSHLRRNKFYMIDKVAAANLLTAKQYHANNIEDLMVWYKQNFNPAETVVIKPLNSAGTDQVTFCSTEAQVIEAATAILGNKNKLGLINDYVLLQSFLKGDEYVVNTVSVSGKHHLTDIWQCYKQRVDGAGFIPGCEVLLPFEGEIQTQLKEYAFNALNALDIKQGPAHFEIMYTSEGPAIIEVGARIQGGVNPDVHLACMGTSQLVMTVDSYLSPATFQHYYNKPYQLKKYTRWADLIVPVSGTLKSFTLLEQAKKLDSFYSANIHAQPGDFLPKTVDLYTSPGSIYFVNADVSKLESDYLTFREIEKSSYVFI